MSRPVAQAEERTSSNAPLSPRIQLIDQIAPPDGGLLAWSQCLSAWLVGVTTWGYVNSFGVFQARYEIVLSASASSISWIGGIMTFFLFFLGTLSGYALDAGYLRPVLWTGAALSVSGILLTSIAETYWLLVLTQGVMTGIGGGLMFCPSIALLPTYFEKNRALALGLATTGPSIGGVVYPLAVQQLLPRVGFGWTMRCLGFINLAALALVLVMVRPRVLDAGNGLQQGSAFIGKSLLKDALFLLYTMGACCCLSAQYFPMYYIPSFARDILDQSYGLSSTYIIIINGVSVLFRPLFGFTASRILGLMNTYLLALVLTAICTFTWLAVRDSAGFLLLVICYGISVAGFQGLWIAVAVSLCRDPRCIGTQIGATFTVVAFATLLGGPIAGALTNLGSRKYMYSTIWAGSSFTVGLLLHLLVRFRLYGQSILKLC